MLALLGVFAVLALASTIRTTAGFGFSLVAVPPLAFLLDPVTAVVVASVIAAPVSVSIAVRDRAHIDRRLLAVILGFGVPAVPLGVWALTALPETALMFVIAGVIVLGTVLVWCRIALPGGTATLAGVSFFAGASYGATGVDGPPMVAAAQGLGLEPRVQRATLAVSFASTSIAAVAGYAVAGELTAEVGRALLVGVPGLVIGVVAGERLFKFLDAARFRRVVLALLVVSSVSVLTRALAVA
ncbi:sulfite exporter TauE/SafE family protein [Glycomyces paridis]|uniref:Probable membrane transporter protein n=1 Tax=Glycomyces paridis TaxID=2126555 RepID=A0A4S8PJ81_9ACTN|nr:sulfite exporter TauE/SafE family protein [Glycomyces paridis]THV28469.1 sulfite exporter TauE/SafE family protein [Glycomyces paridis]